MTIPVNQKMDFGGARRITNLSQGAATGEPVTYDQWIAGKEGLSWKEHCRVAGQVNIVVAVPGATIDGVTMVASDRVLLLSQTAAAENGIYVWNGAATPMTRSLDAQVFNDLESATVGVDEGTSTQVSYHQTQVNGVIGTNNVAWVVFGASASAASTGTAGIAALATQAEVDAGAVANKIVTPSTLASWAGRVRKFSATVGDGSATSIAVTHNFSTTDVQVQVFELTGSKREVFVEKQITSANAVTLLFDVAPAANALRCIVIG